MSEIAEYARPLGIVYALLAAWSLFQLVWIHYYSKMWTIQKSFHALVFTIATGSGVWKLWHGRVLRVTALRVTACRGGWSTIAPLTWP